MTTISAGTTPPTPSHRALAAGDRVRVASGVFGRLARVRSTSPGHVFVQYDHGDREVIDPTRRSVRVVG
jgi:preprotein translocase subunit YajC